MGKAKDGLRLAYACSFAHVAPGRGPLKKPPQLGCRSREVLQKHAKTRLETFEALEALEAPAN